MAAHLAVGAPHRRDPAAEACALVPILRAETIAIGAHDPVAADIDVDLLLQGYLRRLRRRAAASRPARRSPPSRARARMACRHDAGQPRGFHHRQRGRGLGRRRRAACGPAAARAAAAAPLGRDPAAARGPGRRALAALRHARRGLVRQAQRAAADGLAGRRGPGRAARRLGRRHGAGRGARPLRGDGHRPGHPGRAFLGRPRRRRAAAAEFGRDEDLAERLDRGVEHADASISSSTIE
jgi:hypothetical protein